MLEAPTFIVPAMYADEARAMLAECEGLSFTESGRFPLTTFALFGSDDAVRLSLPKREALQADITSREAW
jgi:hypothetical protein